MILVLGLVLVLMLDLIISIGLVLVLVPLTEEPTEVSRTFIKNILEQLR